VELILEFVSAARNGTPLVKQMLMGGGKTTVVGPMLALILGDGETLVVQTMPPALLEQTKATLRATFSSIVRKRVFTLSFDRSSEISWSTLEKLQAATANRGVVLCTASTIKSLQLRLLEKMHTLRDTKRKQHPSMEHDVRSLAQVLTIFRRGCLIMDEVDLLLRARRVAEALSSAPQVTWRGALASRLGRSAQGGAQLPDWREARARPLARALDVRHPRARRRLLRRAQADERRLPPVGPRARHPGRPRQGDGGGLREEGPAAAAAPHLAQR
jgi:hypothetical protein